MTIPTIEKKLKDDVEVAIIYYSTLFKVNSISLSDIEINLIAFSAVRGTLSSPPIREEFIRRFNSSKGTVYNVSSKLKRQGLLIKEKGKLRVNPSLQMDFKKPLLLKLC